MPAIIEDPPDGRTIRGGNSPYAQSDVVPVVVAPAVTPQTDVVPVGAAPSVSAQLNVVPVGVSPALHAQLDVAPVGASPAASPQQDINVPFGSASCAESDVDNVANALVYANTPNVDAESKTGNIAAGAVIDPMAINAFATAHSGIATHPNHMRTVFEWRGSWYIALRSTTKRIQVFRYLDDGTGDVNNPLPDANGIGNVDVDDVSFGFFAHWENVHFLECVISVGGVLKRFRSYDLAYTWTETA